MKCPSCSHENPAEANFCLKCGVALATACPKCGKELPSEAVFCMGCGHDLSQLVAPSESPATSPGPAEGERRQATIVFSDLSGYTAMNERLDPEDVEGIISRIKVEAVKIVESHGGIVSQFVGDEVLALFGIPTAHEDDPRRAVRAVLELHELVRNMSPEVEERIGRSLRMHTGINTGLVVTSTRDVRDGTIGVTGDTVNTSARLKALAKDDQILVSPETQRLITPYFDLETLEPKALKGKAEPMVSYRVVGRSGVQSRFEAAEVAGLTQFTGREVEQKQLYAALSKAMGGQGQIITISGEAGLGKSRLAYEFRNGIDRNQCTLLEGRCQSYGMAAPYLPFLDSLRRGLHLEEGDSPDKLRVKTVTNVLAINPDLEKYLPHYLHLLSIPAPEHPLPDGLGGEHLRQELEEALAAIITENTRRKPMVMILEDWHWTDEASDAALRRLTPMVADYALLLVILHRPEYTAEFGALAHHETITLPVLSFENTASIARSVFGADFLPDGLAGVLHERTGGNPYFAEELCQALIEEGSIRMEGDHAVLTGTLDNLDVPDAVEAVIRSRMDRLNEQSREALRLASVIGREFGRRLLEEIAEGRVRLDGVLEGLSSQELIRQVRLFPEAAYMFKHALMQNVFYETILLRQRKALHGIVGGAIEALYPDRLEEHYETLAHHYSQSDNTEKAIDYLEKAGDKAAGYHSLVEARKQFQATMELLDSLETTPGQKRKRIDVSLKWAKISQYAASNEHLQALETSRIYGEELNDEIRLAHVTYWIGQMNYHMGNYPLAIPIFERCIEMGEKLEDEELQTLPYNVIGRTCIASAEHSKAIEYLEKGIPMMERLGNLEELSYSKGMLGLIYSTTGNFERGFLLIDEALEMAKSIGSKTREAQTLNYAAVTRFQHGEWKKALDSSTSAIEISEKIGNSITAGIALGFQGIALFMLGERKKGLEITQQGVKKIESTGSRQGVSLVSSFLAENLALEGKRAKAVSAAKKTLNARQWKERWGEFAAHRALSIAAALEKTPHWDQVEAYMEESIRFCHESGARPYLAVGYYRSAGLLRKKGDLELARENLSKSTSLFTEMEMTGWLELAEKLGGALSAN